MRPRQVPQVTLMQCVGWDPLPDPASRNDRKMYSTELPTFTLAFHFISVSNARPTSIASHLYQIKMQSRM